MCPSEVLEWCLRSVIQSIVSRYDAQENATDDMSSMGTPSSTMAVKHHREQALEPSLDVTSYPLPEL